MTKRPTIEGLKDLEFNTSFFKLTCDIGYAYTDNKGKFIDKMTKEYKAVSFKDAGETLIFYGLFEGRLNIRITPKFIQGQFNRFDSFDEISHKTKAILEDLVNFLEIKNVVSFGWMHSGIYETENNSFNNITRNLPEGINIGSINANYEPNKGETIKISTSIIKGQIQKQSSEELRDISGILFDIDYIISGGKRENSINSIKNIFSSKESKILSLVRKIVENE